MNVIADTSRSAAFQRSASPRLWTGYAALGSVRIGQVHSSEWNFMLFIDPVEPVVVACLAVDAAAANPAWDYSNLGG